MAIVLNWTVPPSVEPIAQYKIYRKVGPATPGFPDLYAVVAAPTTMYTDVNYLKSVLTGPGYNYVVTAVNVCGETLFSNIINVIFDFNDIIFRATTVHVSVSNTSALLKVIPIPADMFTLGIGNSSLLRKSSTHSDSFTLMLSEMSSPFITLSSSEMVSPIFVDSSGILITGGAFAADNQGGAYIELTESD